MHIYTTCACGKSLRVGSALAGRKIRCPQCQTICDVPPGGNSNRLEDQASAILLSGPSQTTKSARQKPKADLSRTPPPPTRKSLSELVVDQVPRDQQNQTTARSHSDQVEEEEGFGSIHPRTLGGILLSAIAICWLGSGYSPGLFLIFPALLLGAGFLSVVKGLFPGD